MKIISLPSRIGLEIQQKKNVEQLNILVDQYIPEKREFVKKKLKKEQKPN